METKAFIDTSGFFALLVRIDEAHPQALAWFEQSSQRRTRLVTSYDVVSETVTLLKTRGQVQMVARFFEMVRTTRSIEIHWPSKESCARIEKLFLRHHDKGYSFPDSTSFMLMHEQGIRQALTTDHHFRQAGFVPLLKSQ
jgi:uncharacterized protein